MQPPVGGTFVQEVDHPLDASGSVGTFSQRYWYSTEFAHGPQSPVIFYFCGEAPCDPAYVTSMADTAKALNASVVALEHRYYGQSVPFANLTLENMKYLTVHNALEDAAAFQRFAKQNLPLTGPWIAVGGSYAGMLAAFYRTKHPELVVGAWASSAPVNVQLSFWGYDAIAAKALGPDCTRLFQAVLGSAGDAFEDPARREALSSSVFGSSAPSSKADFLQWFSNVAEGRAQYGDTRELCAALEQEADNPMDGFIGYLNPPLVEDPNDPTTGTAPAPATPDQAAGALSANNPPVGIPPLKSPAAIDSFSGYEWFYQVCTEMGFYQVYNVDRTLSVMADLITEDYWADQCRTFVGTTPDVERTRAEYLDPLLGGGVTNILFTNGSLDPWSSLSLVDPDSTPAGLDTFVVQTGSHCEDLQNLQPNSVLGVFQAHKRFYDLAKKWMRP
jgi:hypothetical protein